MRYILKLSLMMTILLYFLGCGGGSDSNNVNNWDEDSTQTEDNNPSSDDDPQPGLSVVCSGQNIGLQNSSPMTLDNLPYSTILVSNDEINEWSDQIPESWKVTTEDLLNTVTCLGDEFAELEEKCDYSLTGQGYPTEYVYRYKYCRIVSLFSAYTGKKVGEKKICGISPSPCPSSVTETYSIYGSSPGLDAIISFLEPRLTRYTIGYPGISTSYGGLTYDGEFLWVGDRDSDYNDRFYKMDIDGNIIDSFRSPGKTPLGIAWNGENLIIGTGWLDFDFYTVNAIGNVLNSFPASSIYSDGVAYDGNNLWAIQMDNVNKFDQDGNIIEFHDISELRTDGLIQGFTYGNGYFWMYQNGNILKLDQMMNIIDTIESVDPPNMAISGLAFDGRYLWVGYQAGKYIYALEPK